MLNKTLHTSLILGLLSATPIVFAADSEGVSEQQTIRVATLSQKVHRALARAQEATDSGDFEASKRVLNDLLALAEKGKLNPYETAMVHNFYGVNHQRQDSLSEAISSFQRVLVHPAIPQGLRQNALLNIAQLNFAVEKYEAAVSALEEWFEIVEAPTIQAYVMIAQGYFQLERYSKVAPSIIAAMKLARAKGQPIKENWLALLRAAYYEQGEYQKTAKTLEAMVRLYPKKQYWVQLSGVYGLLDDEVKQSAALEAAYQGGFLDKSAELIQLAQLLLSRGVPFKAGLILDQGLREKIVENKPEHWQLLAQAWAMARELDKQILALQQAVKLSPASGSLNYYLGQALSENEQWSEAVNAFKVALKTEEVRRDRVHMSLGIAYFNLDRLDEARASFVRAARDERSRDPSSQWIAYLDVEIARRKALVDSAI